VEGVFEACGRVQPQDLAEALQFLTLFEKLQPSRRILGWSQSSGYDLPPLGGKEIGAPGEDSRGARLIEKVPLVAVIDAELPPPPNRALVVEGALKLSGLDEADDLFVFREPFQYRGPDVLVFEGAVEAADEKGVIVKDDGKRGSPAPVFIKLRKLAVAVMPEGKVRPENWGISGKAAEIFFSRGHLV
jgi:hypothetical protein